jgi:hypothetical protein
MVRFVFKCYIAFEVKAKYLKFRKVILEVATPMKTYQSLEPHNYVKMMVRKYSSPSVTGKN